MITFSDQFTPDTKLFCKLCGEIFSSNQQAVDCAKSHSIPLPELLGYDWYNANYDCPDSVFVELSDGRIMEYKLLRMKCAAPLEEEAI